MADAQRLPRVTRGDADEFDVLGAVAFERYRSPGHVFWPYQEVPVAFSVISLRIFPASGRFDHAA